MTHARAQVSDLDGTMVGDDAGTRAFSAYWHGTAAATGSKLVYSTGRALDSFLELAAEKGGDLLRPDVLICAVGTKVYLPAGAPASKTQFWCHLPCVVRCAHITPFSHVSATSANGGWDEDPAWTARMDQGWDLEKMQLITAGAASSLHCHDVSACA